MNKPLIISLIFLLVVCLPVLGFFLGRNYQEKIQRSEESKIRTELEKKTKNLEIELDAALNNRAILEKQEEQSYKRELIGVYSPLLDSKQVDVLTYRYRGKTIVRKIIKIDNYSGVEIWEYDNQYNSAEIPKDFATFGGYENYANIATSVEEIKKSWKESYKTRNGVEMYYEYDRWPKGDIAGVRFDSYHSYYPNFKNSKPSLVQIFYSKIAGFTTNKDDSLVLEAKKELNKIADTIIIGFPEQ